jgi:ABC transport system ATP-binding/permease protein
MKGTLNVNILAAEGISKSYSEKILLDGISIGINKGEKIGVIGINGTGKSTLLQIIAGVLQPDSGRIIKGNSAKIEYLPQNPSFEDGITVLQQAFKGSSPVMELIREYEHTLQKFNENPADSLLEKELIRLTQRMDIMEAWTIEKEAKTILTRLGITDFKANVGTLSGGQRKRVAMAGSLISPTDLLILDEPTNHVDNDTVDWLENYLNKRKGALLMVTHDRYFLERVANRIVELDNGNLYNYQANYSKFLEMKADREELVLSSENKRQNLLRQELEWIRRGAKARSTKQKARIERFETLQDTQTPIQHDDIEIKSGVSRLGKKIIELEHIHKSYSGVPLIRDFSYLLQRDDRMGIIGPNGIGKSTLLKIIAGKLAPDSGNVEIGATVKIGYFSQENDEMDDDLRIIDYIREEAEYVTTVDGSISASQMLQRFLFPPAVHWTPIGKLSGGEKRRLYLLRIIMGAPNVLLLDEPTNDLDIQTLTILESYLDGFSGAVVAVSHDRFFLDRVANKILSFQGNGIVKQFVGNYSDYQKRVLESNVNLKQDTLKAAEDKEQSNAENRKNRPLKFSFNEQKEYEQIEGVIDDLEREIKKVQESIDKSASDFERLQKLLTRQELLEKQLDNALERWTYLNELAEEIEINKSID